MQPQPAFGDRADESGVELIRRAASIEERSVDQLDIDAAVLNRLDPIGDLDELAGGGVRINEAARTRRISWAWDSTICGTGNMASPPAS